MKLILIVLLFIPSIAVADKDIWLDTHNKERSLVGNPPLFWDVKLEKMAKEWARKLVKGCAKLKHSPDRGDIGENLAGSSGRVHPVSAPVEWWIKEKQWYDAKKNECNAPANKSCGHYTQVVAFRSEKIGCAKAKCPGEGNRFFYVCNYEPHGNMRGIPPIKGGSDGNSRH